MPKERLHFLLRHDPLQRTLCYSCKSGEWPDQPCESDYPDEENEPKPPPYTHRARLRVTGDSWRVYLLKMVDGRPEARRWLLCERSSEESAKRYAARHAEKIRRLCSSRDSVLWVVAARAMGYVSHWPVGGSS